MDDAGVVAISPAPDQPGGLERLDDACHRRRTDLLRRCEPAECPRAAEDEHREGGELGRRNAGGRIFPADVPQRVDGGRVKPVSSLG